MGKGNIPDKCNSLEEAKIKWEEVPLGRSENILGQKKNHLTIIYKTKNPSSGSTKSYFVCKCDCQKGNYIRVRKDKWLTEVTKSCGCATFHSLVGEKFGKLTVLYDTGERNTKGCIKYMCQCDCGTKVVVVSSDLTTHHTQSCGCIKSFGELYISQILSENNISFKKEKTFDNCKFLDTNKPAKFDFYVNNQYIIEFDGEQHYKVTNGWNTLEEFNKRQEHDKFKNQYCFEHNIPIIRIPYTHLDNICLEDLIPETSQFLLNQEE